MSAFSILIAPAGIVHFPFARYTRPPTVLFAAVTTNVISLISSAKSVPEVYFLKVTMVSAHLWPNIPPILVPLFAVILCPSTVTLLIFTFVFSGFEVLVPLYSIQHISAPI